MLRKGKFLISALLVFTALNLHAQSPEETKLKFLTPAEVFMAVEKSTTSYNISIIPSDSIEQVVASAMFPQVSQRMVFPVVEVKDGEHSPRPYEFDSLEFDMLTRAETDYQAKRYEQARSIYLEVAEKWPHSYPAVSHIGDTYYFSGDYATALRYYDSAIGLNPYDPQLYYYRGNALVRMGQLDNGIDSYIDALALLPHYPAVMNMLKSMAEPVGLELHDGLFHPGACARRDGEDIAVGLHEGSSANGWIIYGLAKGLWLGEPEHRKKRLGREEYHWSSTEEQECLVATLAAYLQFKKDDEDISDPNLDKLFEMSLDGHLLSYVLYEIGYRMDPNIMLRTDDDVRKKVREYVSRYVVIRKDP